MWIRKQIIDLITLRNDKETLKEIMKGFTRYYAW